MADVTSGITKKRQSPNSETVELIVETANTVDDTDTFDIDLSDNGIADDGLLYVHGVAHTTEGSVLIEDSLVTSVSSGVLTVTVGDGGANTNRKRVVRIIGKSR